MFSGTSYFEIKKSALVLKEPSAGTSSDGRTKPARPYGALVILWIRSADVRPNMPELIKVREICHGKLRKREGPRRSVGLGKRAIQDCVSLQTYRTVLTTSRDRPCRPEGIACQRRTPRFGCTAPTGPPHRRRCGSPGTPPAVAPGAGAGAGHEVGAAAAKLGVHVQRHHQAFLPEWLRVLQHAAQLAQLHVDNLHFASPITPAHPRGGTVPCYHFTRPGGPAARTRS